MNSIDEIIEIYKRDFDVTMLDESLQRTVAERMQMLEEMVRLVDQAPGERKLADNPVLLLLGILEQSGIEFIVVGGLAAVAHGSLSFTSRVDVVYARHGRNIERLVDALADHGPSLRGAPPDMSFCFDLETTQAGLNFRPGD